jgi:hypothetical protein
MVSAACDSRAGAQGRALAQALVLEARSRAVAGHGHVHDHPPPRRGRTASLGPPWLWAEYPGQWAAVLLRGPLCVLLYGRGLW